METEVNDLPRTVTEVTCTQCGCLCDDLHVTIAEQAVTSIAPPCPLAESWYLSQRGDIRAEATVRGEVVDHHVAVASAAEFLRQSTAPLILGLTHSSTDGQRAAVALADKAGAYLAVPKSPAAAASLAAFQNSGASTATLGVIRERADLVIYWGCDPQRTHPRHLARFVEAPGRWAPNGRSDRHVVVVTANTQLDTTFADASLRIEPNSDGAVIDWLRTTVASGEMPAAPEGVDADAWSPVIDRMRTCKYGVIFFGDDIVSDVSDLHTVESLHRMVTELNTHARFTLRYLAGSGNGTGASNVMAWQTGYPNNVDFQRGFPRYDPTGATPNGLLESSAVDAVVILGSESLAALSPVARQRLDELPTVLLAHPNAAANGEDIEAAVRFTIATPGIHTDGVAYRMDEVPLPTRAIFPAALPTAESILGEITDAYGRLAQIQTRRASE